MSNKERVQSAVRKLALPNEKLRGIVNRKRRPFSAYNDKEIEDILQAYYNSGKSINLFCRDNGLARATVGKWVRIAEESIKQAAIPVATETPLDEAVVVKMERPPRTKTPYYSQDEIAAILKEYRLSGKTLTKFTKEKGMPRSTLMNWLRLHPKDENEENDALYERARRILKKDDVPLPRPTVSTIDLSNHLIYGKKDDIYEGEDIHAAILKLLRNESGRLINKLERYRQARDMAILNKVVYDPELHQAFLETKFYHLHYSRFIYPTVKGFVGCFVNMLKAIDAKMDLGDMSLSDKLVLNTLIDLELVIDDDNKLALTEYGKDMLHVPLNTGYEFLLFKNNRSLRFL